MTDPKYDLQAFTQPIDLSGEPKFSPEELEVPDYSDRDWDVEYKEAHIWSFDSSLAIFLDKGLTGIMGFGYSYPPEGIKRARDIFRRRALEGTQELEEVGSEAHADLMWALEWLKDNFTALWT